MPTDSPLTADQRTAVIGRVAHDCTRAGKILSLTLVPPPVRFDLRGTAAGMFCVRGRDHWLRFNPWLFAQDFAVHGTDTVTHEVAHFAVHTLFLGKQRPKPHGPEWRGLMVALGANPSATFKGSIDGVPVRRQRRHAYRCLCQQHAVSTTRHNRIRTGKSEYRCRYCDGRLVPI